MDDEKRNIYENGQKPIDVGEKTRKKSINLASSLFPVLIVKEKLMFCLEILCGQLFSKYLFAHELEQSFREEVFFLFNLLTRDIEFRSLAPFLVLRFVQGKRNKTFRR